MNFRIRGNCVKFSNSHPLLYPYRYSGYLFEKNAYPDVPDTCLKKEYLLEKRIRILLFWIPVQKKNTFPVDLDTCSKTMIARRRDSEQDNNKQRVFLGSKPCSSTHLYGIFLHRIFLHCSSSSLVFLHRILIASSFIACLYHCIMPFKFAALSLPSLLFTAASLGSSSILFLLLHPSSPSTLVLQWQIHS
jgi:hypothetical protein